MPFSQTTITSVSPPVYAGFQVFLSWTCSSPATGYGSGGYGKGGYGIGGGPLWFQVYLNGSLAWWGQTTIATLILGSAGPIRVDIGTVLPGEEQTRFLGRPGDGSGETSESLMARRDVHQLGDRRLSGLWFRSGRRVRDYRVRRRTVRRDRSLDRPRRYHGLSERDPDRRVRPRWIRIRRVRPGRRNVHLDVEPAHEWNVVLRDRPV